MLSWCSQISMILQCGKWLSVTIVSKSVAGDMNEIKENLFTGIAFKIGNLLGDDYLGGGFSYGHESKFYIKL